jgi:hypothetical protein
MDVPVLESCPASRTPAPVPDRLVGDSPLDSMMAVVAREQIGQGGRIVIAGSLDDQKRICARTF